jgi:hypothetical protein
MDLVALVSQLTSALASLVNLVVKLKDFIFNVIPQQVGLPPKIAELITYLIVLAGLYAMFSAAKTFFKVLLIILTLVVVVEVVVWILTGKSP